MDNKQQHKEILDTMHDIYVRKNADYGNSFDQTLDEFGLVALAIRLDDKLRRFKQLIKQDAQVKDESIEDTLLDMSNYSVMGKMWMDKQKQKKKEIYTQANSNESGRPTI